jgi:hypothetical protein
MFMKSGHDVLGHEHLRQPLINDALLMFENDEANLSVLQSIDNFRASPDQVKRWFFSLDPLDERIALSLLDHASTGNSASLKDTLYLKFFEVCCAEKGGSIVAASVGLEDMPDPITPQWYEAAHNSFSEFYSQRGLKIHPTSTVSPQEIAIFSVDKLEDKKLTDGQLGDLLISAEMFMRASASSFLRNSFCVMNSTTGMEMLPPAKIGQDILITDLLLDTILNKVAEKSDPSPWERITALKASALQTTLRLTIKDKDQNDLHDKDTTLLNYVDSLRSAFTGPNSLRSELSKSDLKGLMHELDWLLDIQMVKSAEGHQFNIYPSLSSQDQPIINNPALNRAFDFIIVNEEQGLAVQLKSNKPRFPKKYHPGILVLEEENFLDFNERRFMAKLNAYTNLIKSGFNEAVWADAKSYVLPTALMGLKKFNGLSKDKSIFRLSTPQETAKLYGIDLAPKLNRAQRRQMQRKKSTRKA